MDYYTLPKSNTVKPSRITQYMNNETDIDPTQDCERTLKQFLETVEEFEVEVDF